MANTVYNALAAHPELAEEYITDGDKHLSNKLNELGMLQTPIENWRVIDNGLYKIEKDQDVLVSHEPIIISGIFDNITDGSEGYIVSWFNGRSWKQIARSRDVFVDSRKIIDLSQYGFPVNSNNARKIIQYLEDFYALNKDILERRSYSEQLGWQNKGFLLGENFRTLSDEQILFFANDRGEKQLVEGYHTKGTIEQWLRIVEQVKDFPFVMVGIYASLGSVLCQILKVDPFIFEWSGETSKGKSITLFLSASVWGFPTDNRGGIVQTWNATPVSIERTASLLNSLPLFLDDTKNLPKNMDISNLLYILANGQGKGRGSKQGTQTTKHWKNITFSTGEQKITTFGKDGGVSGRVLPINALPFGNDRQAQLVNNLKLDIQDCYGVAGEQWIDYLIQNKNQWESWRSEHYRNMVSYYSNKANGNSVIGRLSDRMALISTSAMLFNKCFDLDYDYMTILDEVWNHILDDNGEVDRPKQALETVISWFNVNEHRFITARGRGEDGRERDILPIHDLWGKCIPNEDLFVFPHVLENFLKQEGYEPNAIINSWKDRDWIKHESNRKVGRMSVNGKQARGYIVKKGLIND